MDDCGKHNQCSWNIFKTSRNKINISTSHTQVNWKFLTNLQFHHVQEKNIYFTARIYLELNISIVIVCLQLKFSSQGCCIGAVGCFILVVVRFSDWHSSAGWTTSQVPHTSHHHWWHTSLGCTSCGFAVSASPVCL